MLTANVTAGLTEGHLTGAAEGFGGTAVGVVEVELRVGFISKGEDDVDKTLPAVRGADEGCLAVSVGPVLDAERFEPELSASELVARVDALVVVMVVLGAATVAVEEAVRAGGAKVLAGTVIVTSTEEAFATFLAAIEAKGEDMAGLETGDVGFDVALAFPHSASTLAMTSPPPEMDSKVRREEMSASRLLRLFSPGSSGGWEVGNGGACSLAVLTLSAVIRESTVSDGVDGVLSCGDELLNGSEFSFPGLSRERGWTLGVSVRSSSMISTLFAREDFSSGLEGTFSLSFDFSLTEPKRPFSPRRCRPTGWDTVWTRRSPVPRRPPLNSDRNLRDLAELVEEIELRERARMLPSPRASSSLCSISP